MKRIAILELGNSHDECIYSQIKFLQTEDHEIHLLLNSKLTERLKWAGASNIQSYKPSYVNLLKILFYLRKRKIEYLVINTCSGNLIRVLALFLSKSINVTGIVHNGNKLMASFSQRIISRRIKKYFLLNDYIVNNLPKIKTLYVQSFYPIFFPNNKRDLSNSLLDLTDLNICIPGSLDLSRRDYLFLLEQLEGKRMNSVKFICLGRTDHESQDFKTFNAALHEKGLFSNFVLFSDFIDQDTFNYYIEKSDVIMPLIHPRTSKFGDFIKFKITGAFNLAFGFSKPLLMESSWKNHEDFAETSLFYDIETLVNLLEEISSNRESITRLTNNYKRIPKFSFEYQASRYLSFVHKGV